ncbi:MAG TPA: hypothetical protein VKU80_10605 [Planctomycetota bacterium]|nr:hypothetical protein [Planctomycetota bacterium]
MAAVIISAVIGAIGLAATLITLYFRVVNQERREQERHDIEVARERDRQAEIATKKEQAKRQVGLDEEKHREGLRQWEIDTGKMLREADRRRSDIADQYHRDLQACRDDYNGRGMFNSGMRIEAEQRLGQAQTREFELLQEWKQDRERKLAAIKKALDQENARIVEERQKLGSS